jgi:hypothetical protein
VNGAPKIAGFQLLLSPRKFLMCRGRHPVTNVTAAFDRRHSAKSTPSHNFVSQTIDFQFQKHCAMKIQVFADKTIAQIQEDFSQVFPCLKLVFFSKPHKAYKDSAAKHLIADRTQTLGSLEKKPRSGELYIEPEMPTWQVERLFEEEFGLHVQVFRKSGNTWLETSVTDDLTLEEQNIKGKASERHHFEFVDPLNYRERD